LVHDPFLSVTARYADIVLPAATYLETGDLYRAYGTHRYRRRGHLPEHVARCHRLAPERCTLSPAPPPD
jgi:anaerobic selenocysteine-containing dehydrogenase